eukprot:gene10806-biopygen15362
MSPRVCVPALLCAGAGVRALVTTSAPADRTWTGRGSYRAALYGKGMDAGRTRAALFSQEGGSCTGHSFAQSTTPAWK